MAALRRPPPLLGGAPGAPGAGGRSAGGAGGRDTAPGGWRAPAVRPGDGGLLGARLPRGARRPRPAGGHGGPRSGRPGHLPAGRALHVSGLGHGQRLHRRDTPPGAPPGPRHPGGAVARRPKMGCREPGPLGLELQGPPPPHRRPGGHRRSGRVRPPDQQPPLRSKGRDPPPYARGEGP